MRNEQIGQVLLFLQFFQQVDDLGLNRHVQRRHALVANHKLRVHRKRARNRNPLPLSARELVRIPVEHIVLQSALPHDRQNILLHRLARFCGSALEEPVRHKPLFDDLTDGHTRVERGIRVLENDLQILPQQAHFRILQPRKIDAVVQHRFVLLKFFVLCKRRFPLRDFSLDFFDFQLQNRNARLLCRFGFPHLRELLFHPLFACVGSVRKFALQCLRLQTEVVRLGVQLCNALFAHRLLTEQLRPRLGIANQKAAHDFGNVRQRGLRLGNRQILRLNLKERRVVPRRLNLCGQVIRLCLFLFQLRDIAIRMAQGIGDIGGCDRGARDTVIHCRSRRLVIKLEQNAPERGFSAPGFAHNAERFALVDVQRNVLIRADVKLFLLEKARLRNGEILLKIRDG